MKLTVALPKGRLGDESLNVFFSHLEKPFDERKLFFETDEYKILWVKPSDVVTYVLSGVADIGIVGEDTLDENNPDVYRLKELPYGACQLVVAGFEKEDLNQPGILKVASKYPALSERYFKAKNQKMELIYLQGSVELAPLVGLADVIVDIVETGSTLKANGLKILDVIQDSKAILIANKARYRFQKTLIDNLMKASERTPHA
jgi:ATP phosphoribosyltransferase